MDENKIEVGDFVDVDFVNKTIGLRRAEVLYVPQATGDGWILKTGGGRLVYINLFEKMELNFKGKS